jgi:hypothetical protein
MTALRPLTVIPITVHYRRDQLVGNVRNVALRATCHALNRNIHFDVKDIIYPTAPPAPLVHLYYEHLLSALYLILPFCGSHHGHACASRAPLTFDSNHCYTPFLIGVLIIIIIIVVPSVLGRYFFRQCSSLITRPLSISKRLKILP